MEIKEREWAAKKFAETLCYHSGKEKTFAEDFWKRLQKDADIYEEFCYYVEKQQFSLKTSVAGYTLVDIMVWQIDHFKAEMDRHALRGGRSGDEMLLNAFDTFLKMREAPEKYIHAMQEETGTDYPDKFR